jgi:hypothetical protein
MPSNCERPGEAIETITEFSLMWPCWGWFMLGGIGLVTSSFALLALLLLRTDSLRLAYFCLLLMLLGDTMVLTAGAKASSSITSEQWQGQTVVSIIVVCSLLAHLAAVRAVRQRRLRTRQHHKAVEGEFGDRLNDGSMKLLSVEWLMRQPPTFIVRRRQEMPLDAFVPVEHAVELLRQGRVAMLSYRCELLQSNRAYGISVCAHSSQAGWKPECSAFSFACTGLDAHHPDKDAFHLEAIQGFYYQASRPLLSAYRQHAHCALFWE